MSEYGAYFNVAGNDGFFFTNASNNDALFYTETSNQNILFGTKSNAPAVMSVNSNTMTVAGNLTIASNVTFNNQPMFRGIRIAQSVTNVPANLTQSILAFPGYSNSNNSTTLSIGTGTNYLSVNNGTNDVFKVTGAGVLTASNVSVSNLTFSNVAVNGVTGTGNLVLSAAPTFTGTLAAATITATNGSGIQALNAANITTGTLAVSRGGSGNTKYYTYYGPTSTSADRIQIGAGGNSYSAETPTSVAVTITPSDANNKILLSFTSTGYHQAQAYLHVIIRRNDTTVVSKNYIGTNTAGIDSTKIINIQAIDSPGAGTHTYKIYIQGQSTSANATTGILYMEKTHLLFMASEIIAS